MPLQNRGEKKNIQSFWLQLPSVGVPSFKAVFFLSSLVLPSAVCVSLHHCTLLKSHSWTVLGFDVVDVRFSPDSSDIYSCEWTYTWSMRWRFNQSFREDLAEFRVYNGHRAYIVTCFMSFKCKCTCEWYYGLYRGEVWACLSWLMWRFSFSFQWHWHSLGLGFKSSCKGVFIFSFRQWNKQIISPHVHIHTNVQSDTIFGHIYNMMMVIIHICAAYNF